MARRASITRSNSMLVMLKDLVRDLFDPYRPELHYMRGPGPKWHAKHAPAPTPADPVLRQATA